MKAGFIVFLSCIAITCTLYLYMVYQNTQNKILPDAIAIQASRDKAIKWVLDNQEELIKVNNPVLWWFLDESARLANNKKLEELVRKYRTNVLNRNSVWTGYWIKKQPLNYITGSLDYMEKYQMFFVYGLTCNKVLGHEPFIQEQLNISFCNWKPYYSSCSTHQLMGILLIDQNKCDKHEQYKKITNQLVNKIEKLIIWDPRVGDVYIQRILMLFSSGYEEKVKPVWIHRILTEQRENGAWVNFYSLAKVGNIELGFGYKMPEIRNSPAGSLHTTSQAIYLLSLLLSNSFKD